MTCIRSMDISVNNEAEEIIADMEPYINLLAAVFEQTRVDWITSWTGLTKLKKHYDKKIYNEDRKYLKTLEKDCDEYINLNRELKIYEISTKYINTINIFLKSEWIELICACCNLDSESISGEFERLKNNIIKNASIG